MQHAIGCGEPRVHVAIAQRVMPQDVATQLVVEQRRIWGNGQLGVHYRRQRRVLDLDEVQRVLGCGAVDRSDGGDWLADVAHPARCQTEVAHQRRRRNHRPNRIGQFLNVCAGDDGVDAGQGSRGADVQICNPRVRVRTAQHGRLEQPRDFDVIEEHPLAR